MPGLSCPTPLEIIVVMILFPSPRKNIPLIAVYTLIKSPDF
jgi:hypothetical protein